MAAYIQVVNTGKKNNAGITNSPAGYIQFWTEKNINIFSELKTTFNWRHITEKNINLLCDWISRVQLSKYPGWLDECAQDQIQKHK